MNAGYFITGTDTDVGKTWATLALMRYFQNRGQSVIGMKPVASGCILENGRWINADALKIQAAGSIPIQYSLVNPYAYEQPISPDIAGRDNPAQLTIILDCFRQLKAQADLILIESAGGWLTPINAREDMADLAKALALPVILVVALKLGCINHAKLTCRAIHQTGLPLAGWLTVQTDPDFKQPEHVMAVLARALAAPLLGNLPFCRSADFDFLARHINV